MSYYLLYILLAYLIISVVAYFVQERFIFKPEKLSPDFEFRYEAPFREISFKPEENVLISGLHFYTEKPHGLIIYFHGNTRSVKGWGKYARDFYRFGYDVVLVDYRGFGKSTGKRSEAALLSDMQYVYRSLCLQYPEDHIIVYGRSMGSGFACKLAADNHPRYLILDAPYYSFRKVAERFLPFLPMKLVLRYHLRTDLWIQNVKCHTYILHGTRDWLIPLRHSENLQLLHPRRVTLIRIKGGGHNNLPSFPEYHNFIRDILKV